MTNKNLNSSSNTFPAFLPGSFDYHRRTGSSNGRYYSSPNSGVALTNITPTAGVLYAMPLLVSKAGTIDTISFSLEGTGRVRGARIGLYDDDGNCYPNALLYDSGAVTTSSGLGTKVSSPSVAVTLGLYWMVWVNSATSPLHQGVCEQLSTTNSWWGLKYQRRGNQYIWLDLLICVCGFARYIRRWC